MKGKGLDYILALVLITSIAQGAVAVNGEELGYNAVSGEWRIFSSNPMCIQEAGIGFSDRLPGTWYGSDNGAIIPSTFSSSIVIERPSSLEGLTLTSVSVESVANIRFSRIALQPSGRYTLYLDNYNFDIMVISGTSKYMEPTSYDLVTGTNTIPLYGYVPGEEIVITLIDISEH